MAKNPFRYDDTLDNKPNRNVFDLSFQNNATFKFGQITPVMCKEVLAGDSLQMKPTFAINFMPMTFPIQTRMRAYLHFYYVRHRNVWKDWEDFFGGTKQGLVMPYLAPDNDTKIGDVYNTGSLGDYLGLPTTSLGEYGNTFEQPLKDHTLMSYNPYTFQANVNSSGFFGTGSSLTDDFTPISSVPTTAGTYGCYTNYISELDGTLSRATFQLNPHMMSYTSNTKICLFDKLGRCIAHNPTALDSNLSFDTDKYTCTINFGPNVKLKDIGYIGITMYFNASSSHSGSSGIIFQSPVTIFGENMNIISGIDYSAMPYFSSKNPSAPIKVNALPFRGYEMIYNVFYRNSQNNPYILNGVAEYNKYIPTDEGGSDTNHYRLRFRNWEDDFLTTAVQSPQQGVAPLVGLSNRDATVTLAAENGTVTRYTLSTNEDGSVNGVEASDSGNPQLTMALVDAVSYGISIEDFRNVNALQRWLEINIRKGYKYSEVLEAHFGVNIRYNALDMPEFIGGASQDIFVNRISQTNNQSDSDGLPLGWQSGQASCVGSGETITHYFDEPGYVFAMLTIVPVPNYSQLLPKHFLKKDLLDYYFPEFGHIGFQPITYKEVCPIQANAESSAVLDQTFGYQRPWYEYLASTDEVHGDFRTSLRNFVLNRTFDVKPDLSESFLLVDPKQLNDVFNYQADTDKILGQVYFDIKAKRPIPLYGIPKLE